jgi:predicted DNA-binding transcriptional regulator AlpA
MHDMHMGEHMKLLTIPQVAAMLGLSVKSMYQREFRERLGLPEVRFGANVRFMEHDLEQFVQRHRQPVEGQTRD